METSYQGYELITFSDIFILPLSIFISYIFVLYLAKKIFNGNPYYLNIVKNAFLFKLFFMFIFFIILFTIYANRNDQMSFYFHLQTMLSYISDNPSVIFEIFTNTDNNNTFLPALNDVTASFLNSKGFFSVFKTELLVLPFSFNSFLAINVYGTFIGFIGFLLIYANLASLYPNLSKEISWGIFYVPTTCFYTCGIVKEGIAILGMGIIFTFFYKSFICKKTNKSLIVLLFLLFPICFFTKPYIFVLFIPTLTIWVFYPYFKKISIISKLIIFIFIILLILGIIQIIGILDSRFMFENLVQSAELVQEFTAIASEIVDGKGNYEPINIDFSSVNNLAYTVFSGLFLSFFRPFFWEAKNVLFLFVSLENLFLLFLFLRTRNFHKQDEKAIVLIFLLFVLPFSFFVSISNSNFGALLRYKAPMVPFLYSFLIIYGSKNKNTARS
ncbi:hypothetical protein [Runella aurantiaca]|uniref:Glycosyltransferase RgtA/B/C/D-like domain-containing protein n=1 Tax=Runella aurantiaca TaxID=2282308 RepID=A0A369IFM0_9BACT|nr:hypothetical protein [Runella aurantiaca]RDB06283.1 hypothetical protein DVG78_08440 [Runella aurantiaca]